MATTAAMISTRNLPHLRPIPAPCEEVNRSLTLCGGESPERNGKEKAMLSADTWSALSVVALLAMMGAALFG
jgi:hypothetical protein